MSDFVTLYTAAVQCGGQGVGFPVVKYPSSEEPQYLYEVKFPVVKYPSSEEPQYFMKLSHILAYLFVLL